MSKPRAYYNDFDPGACDWLRELIRRGLIMDGEVDERSILDVRPVDLKGFTQCHFFAGVGGWSYALRLAGWPDDRPVWTGSPPCQPFSAAGKQLGRDDARHLAPHFVDLVRACRPGVLFGEQVASADVFGKAPKRAGSNAASPPQWAWLDDLSDRLEAACYAVGASDFPSAGVGAPHIRQRTFFGAQRLDDPASPRHDGPLAGPEGLARNETWLRLSGAGSGHGGVADASHQQHDRPRRGGKGWGPEHTDGGDAGGLADTDDVGPQGRPGMSERAGERSTGAGGVGGGLADSARCGRREEREDGRGGAFGDCPEGVAAGLGAGCGDSGMGDTFNSGRQSQPYVARSDGPRVEPRGWQSEQFGQAGGYADGVADADGWDSIAERQQRGWQCGQQPEDGRTGDTHQRPGPTNGFWSDVDWIFCRDGKWRPAQRAVLGLADGLPGVVVPSSGIVPAAFPLAPKGHEGHRNRVMRLRGYGNAINPHAAAEFIRAFADAVSEVANG